MKKFDLFAKKRELDERRIKDTRETIGTRIAKLFVGLIGAFMLWSAFTTVEMPDLARILLNIILICGTCVYYWKSGVFRRYND